MKISAIVCAYNEAVFLPACLHSLFSQTRPPDEIIVVNNASTDETGAVARAMPGVRVVDEPAKGLVVARETGRRAARATSWPMSMPTAGRRCSGWSGSSAASSVTRRSSP